MTQLRGVWDENWLQELLSSRETDKIYKLWVLRAKVTATNPECLLDNITKRECILMLNC